MSRGNSRDELRCPFTLELVCLYGYSSMKHLRPVADVGHELEWHHTLKQTIKCTLEKSKGMKRMQGRTFFFLILTTFVYSNWRNFQCLYCSNIVII